MRPRIITDAELDWLLAQPPDFKLCRKRAKTKAIRAAKHHEQVESKLKQQSMLSHVGKYDFEDKKPVKRAHTLREAEDSNFH